MGRSSIDNVLSIYDRLLNKVITYYATIWKDRRNEKIYEDWLKNFNDNTVDNGKEKLHALFLLSKFMYFGNEELRVLLKCIYRDLFKYPIVAEIRRKNGNILDYTFLSNEFEKEFSRTRFLGVGNPSESGVHLLYYFRQENNLGKKFFINLHEVLKTTIIKEIDENGIPLSRSSIEIKNTDIRRFVFIDDFCGSGTQAELYLKSDIETVKHLDPTIEFDYLMLFGADEGIKRVREMTMSDGSLLFNKVESVFTIDDSFKCFSDKSRYFASCNDSIEKEFCESMCKNYGNKLNPDSPLGFGDGQLLLSLFHNTPDNTLPIFWSESCNWQPIFKRFHKIY